MADKDFKIRIQTSSDTRGADDAAESLGNLGEKSAEAGDSLREILGDDLADRMEALKDRIGETSDSFDGLAESSEKAAEASREIANRQRAQELSRIGQGLSSAGTEMRKLAEESRRAGLDGAGSLSQMADVMEGIGGLTEALSSGFASGGPLGAAIGALAFTAKGAFESISAAQIAAARRQTILREETEAYRRELARTREEEATLEESRQSARRLSDSERLLEIERERTTEMRRQVELAARIRGIEAEALKAEDVAALAEIDAAEATEGMTPQNAEAARREVRRAADERAAAERETRAREQLETVRQEIARTDAERRRAEAAITPAEDRREAIAQRIDQARGDVKGRRDSLTSTRASAAENPFFEQYIPESEKALEDAQAKLDELEKRASILDSEILEAKKRFLDAVDRRADLEEEAAASQAILNETINTEDRRRAARSRTEKAEQTVTEAAKSDGEINVGGTAGALRRAAANIAPSGPAARAARDQLFGLARQIDADSTRSASEVSQLIGLIGEINARLGREGEARRQLQAQITNLEGQIRNNRD
jgi:hypothetical protein